MSRSTPPMYHLNAFRILALALRARALRKRETWNREQIGQHQERELAGLRRFAAARSPFYQRSHKGLEGRPLHELPILTKQELMQSWDDVVTDRSLRLEDIQRFLERVLVLRPRADFDEEAFVRRIGHEIEKLGAKRPKLRVERIDELRRTKLGKLITVQALPRGEHR